MGKILLDTSVQIGKFKYKEIKSVIETYSEQEDVVSSFYVLFEFRAGFILNLIHFWQHVYLASSVGLAKSRWSESMKTRELKEPYILDAIITEKFGDIPADKKKYLRKIESAIFYIDKNFFTGIKKYLVGDFRHNDIAKYEINSSDDYTGFVTLCEKQKGMLDQKEFWIKHRKELLALVGSGVLKKEKQKMYEALEKIQNDIKYASMSNTNKVVGDAVIAVDMRNQTKVLTSDSSYKHLCEVLAKEHILIPNRY